MFDRRSFLATSTATALAANSYAGTWDQWRGPSRNGLVDGDFVWPNRITGRLQEVWRQKLQPSYSGPIVAEGKVFVTETANKKNEVVSAFSLEKGEKLWDQSWSGSMSVPFFARSNGSWIRSTPAFADGRLLVGGMRDVLVCLDAESGQQLWANDFVKTQKSKVPSFGFVCSPLVDGEFAFVQAGGGLLKLEMATGTVVWRSLADGGGMYGSAFSSPVMSSLGGKKQLLVQTRKELTGVDPIDGKKLWGVDIPAFRGMNILPPTAHNDTVFTSCYQGGSFCFSVEQGTGTESSPKASSDSSSDDSWTVKKIWKNTVQGYMSNPLVFDDHVYLHLRNQRLTCLDLATGRQRWSSRPYGKYWSTVTQGEHMLSLDERGDLLLVKPSPDKFLLLDKTQVASNSWAHLAMVDDLLLVRDLDALIVYRWT